MLDLLAQIAAAYSVLVWVWFIPNILADKPLVSRPWWLRAALAAVKYAVECGLTWPRRRQAERYAGQIEIALRMKRRKQDPRYRELMLIGPGMTYEPQGFEPGIRPPEPQPSIFAPPVKETLVGMPGPSSWAPAAAAAMPTERCKSCPAFGCSALGADPECEWRPHVYRPDCGCDRCSDVLDYEEVTAHEQNKPVGYVPIRRRSEGRDADGVLRYRIAMMQARRPRPGDDEPAKPPRDEFDAHIPPLVPPVTPGVDRLPCLFCGGPPILGEDGSWLPGHGKRCVLRKRDRRRRPSGAQRRKLRDRISGSIEAAVAEQLTKDARQLGTQGRAELGRLAESLREHGQWDAQVAERLHAMWPYEPGPPDRVRK